jgi:hypothetical protein
MPFTSLQHHRTHRLKRGREMAVADRRAMAVGRYDALLHRWPCPYPPGSAFAVDWQIGYEQAQQEQAEEHAKTEAALKAVGKTLLEKVTR